MCPAARDFRAGQAIFPQEYFVYFKGKWRSTARKGPLSGRVGRFQIHPRRRGFRPCAGLSLSPSTGGSRSRNSGSSWTSRPHCCTSRSRTGGSSCSRARSRPHCRSRRTSRSPACRCRCTCTSGSSSTSRRPSRKTACSTDCSTAAGQSPGISGRRNRYRNKPLRIPPKKSPGTSVPGAFYALRARLVSGSVGFRLDGRHRRVDDLLRLALRPLRLFHKGSPRR